MTRWSLFVPALFISVLGTPSEGFANGTATSGDADPRITIALITVVVSIAIFIAKVIIDCATILDKRRSHARLLHEVIRKTKEDYDLYLSEVNLEEVCEQILKEPDYIPFTTFEPSSTLLLDEIRGEFSFFPSDALKAAVDHYVEDSFTHAMIEDLRSDDFKLLTGERNVGFMEQIHDQSISVSEAAGEALRALDKIKDRKLVEFMFTR